MDVIPRVIHVYQAQEGLKLLIVSGPVSFVYEFLYQGCRFFSTTHLHANGAS